MMKYVGGSVQYQPHGLPLHYSAACRERLLSDGASTRYMYLKSAPLH